MSRPPRVLVLEDNPVMLKAMTDALEDQGYEVLPVDNSGAAIEVARTQAFDLVVTDIRMEGLDGLQALEQVKSFQPQIASMVVTGYSSEAESLRAIHLGAGDYLQKPFALNDFTSRIERLLQKRPGGAVAEQLSNLGWQLALNLLHPDQRGLLLESAESFAAQARSRGQSEQSWRQAGMAVAARKLGLPLGQLPSEFEETVSARSLLSLGRALEAAGDLRGAEQVYAEIEDGLENVLAGVALARLAQARGQRELAAEKVQSALLRGAEIGAWKAVLDGSFLLEQLGENATSWFQRSAQGLTDQGDLGLAARAHLALGNNQALSVLLQPQYAGDLAGAAALLGRLLESGGEGDLLWRALGALVREAPAEVRRLLDENSLSVEGRLRLVEALTREGRCNEDFLRELSLDREAGVQSRALQALQRLGPSKPPFLRIYTLGSMAVYHGQDKIEENAWKTQKNRLLLAFLALAGDRGVAEERAAAEFWPDSNAQSKNLTGALSVLRNCLRPPAWNGELEYILRSPGQIFLNRQLPRWHDVDELEAALREANRCLLGDLRQPALRWALRAAGLYRGEYLEDCYLDWVTPVRARLHTGMCDTLWTIAQATESSELLQKLLEVDSCHQSAYALMMRIHLSRKRADLAIKTFERCERCLKRELETEPNLELVELWQRARLAV